MKKLELYKNKNWVYKKYVNERLSLYKIGEICHVHAQTILNWMKKFNIKTRTLSEALKGEKSYIWGKHLSEEIKKKISKTLKGNIPWNKGKKRPEMMGENNPMNRPEVKIKMSKLMMGENNPGYGKTGKSSPSWKGENCITPLHRRIREFKRYKRWRKIVFERDDYICQNPECQKRGDHLQAHHIFAFAKYPELRFDINNGLTSCIDCHKEVY